jgi:hypothetical protein
MSGPLDYLPSSGPKWEAVGVPTSEDKNEGMRVADTYFRQQLVKHAEIAGFNPADPAVCAFAYNMFLSGIIAVGKINEANEQIREFPRMNLRPI